MRYPRYSQPQVLALAMLIIAIFTKTLSRVAMIMALILRPAQSFSKLNSPQRDDYDVMEGNRRIGRVYQSEMGTDRWRWSLSSAVCKGGLSGRAATRVLALQALADTYSAVEVLKGTEYEQRLSMLKTDTPVRRRIRSVINSF